MPELNAFDIMGFGLALWGVVIGALGLSRQQFPASRAGEALVATISVVLVAGAIASAIITSIHEEGTEPDDKAASTLQVDH